MKKILFLAISLGLLMPNSTANYDTESPSMGMEEEHRVNEIKKGFRWMLLGTAVQVVGGGMMMSTERESGSGWWHDHEMLGAPVVAAGSAINLYGLIKIYRHLE